MSLPTIFLFSDYWWFYLIFTGFVCLVLSIDLGIFIKIVINGGAAFKGILK